MKKLTDYGYYIYSNRIFYDRQDAFDYGLANGVYDGKLYYYFNENVYDKINWQSDIPISLSDLYLYRAKQLREQYDYLILSFSGGSDSVQILMTFLNNNIFLDEIIIANYQQAIEKVNGANAELDIFREYKLAAELYLKEVHKRSPNTKITVLDLSNVSYKSHIEQASFDHIRVDRGKFYSVCSVIPTAPRSYAHHIFQHILKNNNKSNTALVRGVDKPSLRITEGELLFNFYDIAFNGVHNFGKNTVERKFDVENFYWSPDCPFIPVKQSQVIKKVIETNALYRSVFFKYDEIIKQHTSGISPAWELERTYNPIIYPNWNPSIFTASKPTFRSSEFALWEALGYKHSGQTLVDEINSYTNKVYDKFVNRAMLRSSIRGKFYSLGKIVF
jgi:hypothetical protein